METSVVINAPPDRVWKVVSDPRNLPRWDRHVSAVRGVPAAGLEQGDEYSTEMRLMGVQAKVGVVVLEIRPEAFSKIRLWGPLNAVVETTLEPIGDDRTLLTQHVDYRFIGGPLGRFAASAVQHLGAQALLHKGVLEQKRQVEEGG